MVPVDESGAVPAYEAADVAGVPVISVTRDAETDLKVSYVGAEWKSYGTAIAEWTCDHVEPPATIAMIKGPAGASHVDDMASGYQEYLEATCPGLEVVFEANAQTDGAEPGVALAQDALSAYADVDVIYVNADDTAMGVIQALTEQGKVDDVVVTGFNGEPQAFDAIRAGTMEMTFALRPYAWGQLAMESMLAHLDGEELPDLVPIQTQLVDQETIASLSDEDLR
jgi:ribose transport system substrate-binding protein